jgi:tRNA (cmo5U34)-methyltransferase
LDIGADYGALTKLVLDAYPHATVVVHDYSEPMLMEARIRLAGASDCVSYARGDLQQEAWVEDLGGPFDAVISAIAIHNVRYPRRIRAIYREIFDLLVRGGCFYNVDYVTLPGELVTRARQHALLMEQRYRVRQETGRWPALVDVAPQVASYGVPQVSEAVDEPASLANQLLWLTEAGFRQSECFWHDGYRALMGAFRD